MNIIGLTFAKGMSTRLPRKNVLPFAGRPLVEWTLIQYKASRYMTDYWMVTDSEEIGDLCHDHGFRVVWQSYQSVKEAGYFGGPICEKLFLDASCGQYDDDDVIVSGCPTSPLRKPEDIDVAVAKYLSLSNANKGKHVLVGTLCRRKDLALYEDIGDGHIKPSIFDNQAKYLTTNGSISVRSYGFAKRNMEPYAKMHKEYREGKQYPDDIAIQPDINTYVENEVWQQWDIDRREDFDLCEQLFKANGLGDSAYYRYNLGRNPW